MDIAICKLNLLDNNNYCPFAFCHEPSQLLKRRTMINRTSSLLLLLHTISLCIAKSHIQQALPLKAQNHERLPQSWQQACCLRAGETQPTVASSESVCFITVVHKVFRTDVIPPLLPQNVVQKVRGILRAGSRDRGWRGHVAY